MEKPKWDKRDSANLSFEKDRAYGFSWPQRNYRCSFCKKEFKSAQALGGHMNVHRRDRARMRLSPSSWDSPITSYLNSNPNPNPNPSLTSLSPSTQPSSLMSSKAKLLPYNNVASSFTAVKNNLPSSDCPNYKVKTVPGVDRSSVDMRMLCGGDGEKIKNGKVSMFEFASCARRKEARVWKANDDGDQFVRLDLKLGLLQEAREDLDLELRLGYNS